MLRFWWLLWLLHPIFLTATSTTSLHKRDYSRGLTLVTTVFLKKRSWLPPFETKYYVHTALQFGPAGDDSILRVQLTAVPDKVREEAGLQKFEQRGGRGNDLLLSLFSRELRDDYKSMDANLGSVVARTYTDLGTVVYSNAQIMEQRKGTGLAWNAWKTDANYRSGRSATGQMQQINDCNSFTQRLLRIMNVEVPEKTRRIFDSSLEHAAHSDVFANIDVTLGMYRTLGRGGRKSRLSTIRSIGKSNPRPAKQFFNPYMAPELGGPFAGDNPYALSPLDDIEEEPPTYDGPLDRAMKSDWGLDDSPQITTQWDKSLCPRSRKRTSLLTRACAPRSLFADGEIFAASSRVGGTLESVRVVATGVAEALGVAATVASAVFVIIDFVNHDWVGGGFALAGLIGGLAVAALVAGPAGWILSAGVTAFFMILPGAFTKAVHPPRNDDKQQILRWAAFGDSTHSGDEQCKEQHPGANCTVVYGAGVLSLIFQWDNFDSIAFLARYNDGWAMTLPEIADVFQIVDSEQPNNTAQAAAVIDCGTPPRIPSRWRLQQGGAKWCPAPKFSLRREHIVLPNINQTADVVYKRIIPQPGGDCLLVSETASKTYLPDYNITVFGGQAAIACNITAGYNNGTSVIPLDNHGLPVDIQGQTINATAILDQAAAKLATSLTDSSNGNNTGINTTSDNMPSQSPASSLQSTSPISPGSASTDDQAGHHIDPPPPSSFQSQLLNTTNAVCFSTNNDNSPPALCLPNGTYSIQDGSTGYLPTTKATTLTFPPSSGASLSFSIITPGHNGQHPLTTQKHFSENVTSASNDDFTNSISRLSPSQTFSISIPPSHPPYPPPSPPPPLLCLFTRPAYLGQVLCLGPGGGPLPTSIRGKVASLRVYGGSRSATTAWVYAKFYGDVGGLRVTGDVPDLSAVAYGPEKGENWGGGGGGDGRVVAAWVVEG